MKSPIARHPPFKLLCYLAAGWFGAAPMQGTATEDPTRISQANNAFAIDLYSELSTGKAENLFFSPASIETSLAMAYAGARRNTAAQMAKVLHLQYGDGTIHKDFGALLAGLNAAKTADGRPRSFQLSEADALWGQKGYPFLPDFLNLIKSNYGAGFKEVDFTKENGDGARRIINNWVAKETNDKIKNLIAPGLLTSDTKLVLTNAIYFKGTWSTQFDKAATLNEPFHVTAARVENVPMMRHTASYGYAENRDFQAIKLPYKGNELSMIILLPRHADGLSKLERKLSPKTLSDCLGKLSDQEVDVSIPRFRATGQFELNNILASMGMTDAFSARADFSGIVQRKSLMISNVIHSAFLAVNEEGAEAAAATAVGESKSVMIKEAPPQVFRADHPFLFIIRDEKSGAFLFMGRPKDPV
jgi:serpin B